MTATVRRDLPLRERKKLNAMRAIQAEGLDLVEARRYDAVSVEDIAAAAVVSASSVYRYFETKEGIFLWDEAETPLLAAIADRLTMEPPVEALRLAVHALVDDRFERDRPTMLRRLRLMYTVPALAAAARTQTDQFRHGLATVLAAGVSRDPGDFRIQVAAAAAVGALTAAVEGWAVGNGERPFAELLDEAFDVIASGLQS